MAAMVGEWDEAFIKHVLAASLSIHARALHKIGAMVPTHCYESPKLDLADALL